MTGKERAALRAQAQELDPILHIGKDGVTDAILKQASEALDARELIKCTVQQNAPLGAREACDLVCEGIGCEPVSTIGRRFVVYRYSPKLHEKNS